MLITTDVFHIKTWLGHAHGQDFKFPLHFVDFIKRDIDEEAPLSAKLCALGIYPEDRIVQ